MKKTIKLLTVLPLFMVVGCTNNNTSGELKDADAKTYVKAAKEEIEKDTFVTPTKGTITTLMDMEVGEEDINVTSEKRYDTTEGSRYIYTKAVASFGTSETYVYEMDNKYYLAVSGFGMDMVQEYETEEEFETSFNEYLETSGLDEKSIKTTFTSYLDNMVEIYDKKGNAVLDSDGVTYTYDIKFTKYNESSFKAEVTTKGVESSDEEATVETVIEYENYLPKKISSNTNATIGGQTTKGTASAEYAWGTCEYIYPNA